MQLDPKQIKETKNGYKIQETDFNLLVPAEKSKVRVCAKWNFYSQKCMKCKYELICADQWKVREWLGDKTRREQQEKTKLIQETTILLDNIKETLTKENLSIDQLISIKNNLQIV